MRRAFNVLIAAACFGGMMEAGAADIVSRPKTLEQWAQEALERSFAELKGGGKLAPPSRSYFDAEVLAAPMVFVRNYEVTRETTSVDVDRDRLGGFLNFERTGLNLRPESSICVSVRQLAGCALCSALSSEIQSSISRLFERRGLRSLPGPEFAPGSNLSGDRAFEDYAVRSQAQGCDFAFLAAISSYSDSSVEAGVLKIDSFLEMRDQKQSRVRGQSSLRISESGAAEILRDKRPYDKRTPASNPRIAVMVGAGAIAQASNKLAEGRRSAALGGALSSEVFLRLEGVSNYQDFTAVRDRILSLVPGLELQERLLAPGRVDFAYARSLQETLHKKLKEEVAGFGAVGGVPAEIPQAGMEGLTIRLRGGSSG